MGDVIAAKTNVMGWLGNLATLSYRSESMKKLAVVMAASFLLFMGLIAVSGFSERGLADIGWRRRGIRNSQRMSAIKPLITLQERKKFFVLRA
ncbi:hypothetical protein [Slackia isoflavoniconvertens]|uniref:hypothetical protein n=1 Tax=Slackia isoflavoniconvertens TaxID=572010 RepID=UPI003FD7BB10